ncbi:MAG TPA: tetratricopeptide repeat protein [Chryseolinea sp.]|nr:tetratricopeptide repeat protein [Chryseolinea sp.]
MRYLLLLIGLFLFFESAIGQNKSLDSLYLTLQEHPKEDTIRVKTLVSICRLEVLFQPIKNKEHAEEALRISKKINFVRGIGNANRYIANYYHVVGEYPLAIKHTYDMLRAFERIPYAIGLSQAYQLLGILYDDAGDLEKAKDCYSNAIELCKKADLKKELGYCYNNLAALHFGASEFVKAHEFFLKSIEIRREIKDERGLSTSYGNLASVYVKQERYNDALVYFEKALPLAKKMDYLERIANIYEGMGEMYTLTGEYEKAESYLLNAISLERKLNNKKQLQTTHNYLASLETKRRRFEKALQYVESANQYKDSIYTEDKAKQIADIGARYEVEKKDQAIQLLERDRRIQLIWTNILIVVLALLVILSVVTYRLMLYRERKNRKILNLEIDQLETQHQELSEKFKNVLTGGSEGSLESQDQGLLKKAIKIVEDNIGDSKFTVETMAKEIGMSRTNLHRRIKAITGFPPSELIRNIRLRKAATLLLNQTESVSQIGYIVGFEDHSYFSKSFKKQFGVPPSEYLRTRVTDLH